MSTRIWKVVALARVFPGAMSSAKGLQKSLLRYKVAKEHGSFEGTSTWLECCADREQEVRQTPRRLNGSSLVLCKLRR